MVTPKGCHLLMIVNISFITVSAQLVQSIHVKSEHYMTLKWY